MDISGRAIWQVAAGDTDRSYAPLCIEWDVILNGSGDCGPWPECTERLRREKSYSEKKLSDLRRFWEEMREGDLVVLRIGTAEVHAVGEVIGAPLWLDDFGDIDGWDLQLVRRVRWFWKANEEPKKFSTYALKLGDTVQNLTSDEVKNWISSLDIDPDEMKRSVIALPGSCINNLPRSPVTVEQVGDYLFDRGVAAPAIDGLVDSIDDLQRVANWYWRTGQQPSEHETVAYLVVPLLRTLGWTPQKMAVEWNKIDVALFDSMPRGDHSLTVAVEVKKLGKSSLTAKGQAEWYAKQSGRDSCSRIIVTDGIRYAVYERAANGDFGKYPYAYLNLTRMMSDYPILCCKGAKEALLALSPEGVPVSTG